MTPDLERALAALPSSGRLVYRVRGSIGWPTHKTRARARRRNRARRAALARLDSTRRTAA